MKEVQAGKKAAAGGGGKQVAASQVAGISNAFLPDSNAGGSNQGEASAASPPTPVQTDSLFSMKLFNAEQDLPIVYSDNYNMSLLGLELMHRFDTRKYRKMADFLNDLFFDTPFVREPEEPPAQEGAEVVRRLKFMAPNRPVSVRELAIHHTEEYISQIQDDKALLARITETWALNLAPACLIESRLLTPLKWQVAGTIFAFHLAIQHGWSINLGGGFHQSSAHSGDTYCIYSDVLLAIKYVWRKHPLQKFMIIDLDAHQATGVERDLCELSPKRRKQVFMVDVFNDSINPPDSRADQGIDVRVSLGRFTGDSTYMKRLKKALDEAFGKFKPTLVVYVSGQDGLKLDQLGLMNLSDEALMERDELVFKWAVERQKCSIVMLLGGGYLTRGAKIQADSIRNLYAKSLIWGGHRSGSGRSLSRPRAKRPHRQHEEPSASQHSSKAVKGFKELKPTPTAGHKSAPAGHDKSNKEPATGHKSSGKKKSLGKESSSKTSKSSLSKAPSAATVATAADSARKTTATAKKAHGTEEKK